MIFYVTLFTSSSFDFLCFFFFYNFLREKLLVWHILVAAKARFVFLFLMATYLSLLCLLIFIFLWTLTLLLSLSPSPKPFQLLSVNTGYYRKASEILRFQLKSGVYMVMKDLVWSKICLPFLQVLIRWSLLSDTGFALDLVVTCLHSSFILYFFF